MKLFKDRCDLPGCWREATRFIKFTKKGKFEIVKHCDHHFDIALEVMGDDYEESRLFDPAEANRCKHAWGIAAEISRGRIKGDSCTNEERFGAIERCQKCSKVREKIYEPVW